MHYWKGLWQQMEKSTTNNQKVSRGEYTTKTLCNKNFYCEEHNFCQMLFLTPQPTVKVEHHHGIENHGDTSLTHTWFSHKEPFKHLPC